MLQNTEFAIVPLQTFPAMPDTTNAIKVDIPPKTSKDEKLDGLKQKCKDLKQKISDLEHQNQLRAIAISRGKNSVNRLRFEYAVLLETLERRALDAPIPNADKLDADDLDKDNLDSLRLADITRLLTDTPLAVARFSAPPSGNYSGFRPSFNSQGPATTSRGTQRRRRGNGMSAAKRRLRDPDLPKRPTNAYLIFCDLGKEQVRTKMEEEHPGMNVDMSKAMTEAWKELDQEARKPYYELYEKDKERYQRELKEYMEKKKREKSASVESDGKVTKKRKVGDKEPSSESRIPSSSPAPPSEDDGVKKEDTASP